MLEKELKELVLLSKKIVNFQYKNIKTVFYKCEMLTNNVVILNFLNLLVKNKSIRFYKKKSDTEVIVGLDYLSNIKMNEQTITNIFFHDIIVEYSVKQIVKLDEQLQNGLITFKKFKGQYISNLLIFHTRLGLTDSKTCIEKKLCGKLIAAICTNPMVLQHPCLKVKTKSSDLDRILKELISLSDIIVRLQREGEKTLDYERKLLTKNKLMMEFIDLLYADSCILSYEKISVDRITIEFIYLDNDWPYITKIKFYNPPVKCDAGEIAKLHGQLVNNSVKFKRRYFDDFYVASLLIFHTELGLVDSYTCLKHKLSGKLICAVCTQKGYPLNPK